MKLWPPKPPKRWKGRFRIWHIIKESGQTVFQVQQYNYGLHGSYWWTHTRNPAEGFSDLASATALADELFADTSFYEGVASE